MSFPSLEGLDRESDRSNAISGFDRPEVICHRCDVIGDYLEHGPYRFSMTFGRGEFSEFWGPTAENSRILAERHAWLAEDQSKYLAALPEALELLEEAKELGGFSSGGLGPATEQERPTRFALFLGENWEPDWLILRREDAAARLMAGCVCFPSSWSLAEKIGKPIEAIHQVVPALNSTVGKQIGTFLDRIKPGISWTRNNWGLSRSAEWNQHPSRRTPRLDESVALNEVFFRVEEQSLVALPKSGGVLFGIRLKVTGLDAYAGTAEGLRLADLLETMPLPMAEYKGIASARERIAQLLRARR